MSTESLTFRVLWGQDESTVRFRVQQDESLAIWRSPAHRPPSFDAHFRPLRQRCARAHEAHRHFTLGFAHDEGVFVHGEIVHTTKALITRQKNIFCTTKGIYTDVGGRDGDKVVKTKNASKSRRTLSFSHNIYTFFYTREAFFTRRRSSHTDVEKKHGDKVNNTKNACKGRQTLYFFHTRKNSFLHDGRIFTRRRSYTDVGGRHAGCVIVVNKTMYRSDGTREIAPATMKKNCCSFVPSVRGTLGSMRRLISSRL